MDWMDNLNHQKRQTTLTSMCVCLSYVTFSYNMGHGNTTTHLFYSEVKRRLGDRSIPPGPEKKTEQSLLWLLG